MSAESGIEKVVTGGFGWKHAFAIIGLSLIGAALFRRNTFGLGGIADKIAGIADNVKA